MVSDSIDAYAQVPTPDEHLYVQLDEQYRDLYRAKHGIEIPSGFLLPFYRDFTGQPQNGALWDQPIYPLLPELGLKGITHQP